MGANADPAVATLARILENSETAPHLDEWLASPTSDISARLVHLSPPPGPSSSTARPPTPRSLRSDSSMAPACIHQPSTASTAAPSLFNYSDATTPTETSIDTGLASRFTGVPLLEDVNGVLERPPPHRLHAPAFECAFWFLTCSYISHDQDEWRTHTLSHFRGEEPPKSVTCPLCEEFGYSGESGWAAWELRMEHVACHHVLGTTLRASRPDFHLFQHLWQKRLIDDQDLKELKGGNHNLVRAPGNFTSVGGRAREREGRAGTPLRQHVGRRRQMNVFPLSPRPGPQ